MSCHSWAWQVHKLTASMGNTRMCKMCTQYGNTAFRHRYGERSRTITPVSSPGITSTICLWYGKLSFSICLWKLPVMIRDQSRNVYQTQCSRSWGSREGNMVNYKSSKRKGSLYNSLEQNLDNKRRTIIIQEPKGCAVQTLFYQREWIIPLCSTTTLQNRFKYWPVIWLSQDWLAIQL